MMWYVVVGCVLCVVFARFPYVYKNIYFIHVSILANVNQTSYLLFSSFFLDSLFSFLKSAFLFWQISKSIKGRQDSVNQNYWHV